MKIFHLIFLSAFFISQCYANEESFEDIKKRVIVVANINSAESVALAKYYIKKRKLSRLNLFYVSTSLKEEIGWSEFLTTIYTPLQKKLLQRQWIEGVLSQKKDRYGRGVFFPWIHHISYMVICKGIPLKTKNSVQETPRKTMESIHPLHRISRSAIDTELSLLAYPNYPLMGWIPNPFFNIKNPNYLTRNSTIKVSRLDGPTFKASRKIIDNSIEAEKKGLIGRAYIDRGEDTLLVERWLQQTSDRLKGEGFDLDIDTEEALFSKTNRFDAPALYFGWHQYNAEGLWLDDRIELPVGSIFFHIHSFSGTTARSTHNSWVGPLINKGVTATMGNVFEPYLELTHHPHLFLDALLDGKTLADAAYYSLPALSWQSILIGDPLYRPFAKKLTEQINTIPHQADELSQYSVIRYLNLLINSGKRLEALDFGRSQIKTLKHNNALKWHLSKYMESQGFTTASHQLLKSLSSQDHFIFSDIPFIKQVADKLYETNKISDAIILYGKLLESTNLPNEMHESIVTALKESQELGSIQMKASLTNP